MYSSTRILQHRSYPVNHISSLRQCFYNLSIYNNTAHSINTTQSRHQSTQPHKKKLFPVHIPQPLHIKYSLPHNISDSPIQYEQTIASQADSTTAAELAHKIRRYKPITPGIRHLITIDRSELSKHRPIDLLVRGRRKSGGRTSNGRITNVNIGGGHKQLQRTIDFKRQHYNEPAIVQRLEYDPTRTAYIALLQYNDSTLSYILAPHDLKVGDIIMSSNTGELDTKIGNSMLLKHIPVGTTIHNLELTPGTGGQLARSAGTYCQLIGKNVKPGYALVELSSKEQRLISLQCQATIGSLSNPLHKIKQLGKAGRNRWLGRRPHVRGVAMNPVDHPMGGGFNAKGRQPCSSTGVLSKGYKTRNKKKSSSKFILVPRGGKKANNVINA